MGQAALKYDDFDELDQVPIPEGGIATFLTAETGSWADDDDDVPPKGITNVVKIADKLAEYGRNEDEYMVHAAEGETVIPMEVFERNPALKHKLFAEMRFMGIEPERYIVGNELNSINPVTGQPEFFLKKLFRGLKKAVKAVLPVVAKVFLTTITGNPALASAIVDGATAVIKGGSLKDGLKAAAIGGISSFAAGKIGAPRGWAQSGAKQLASESAISTALEGGNPRDILKSAAVSGIAALGTQAISDRFFSKPTGPEPRVIPNEPDTSIFTGGETTAKFDDSIFTGEVPSGTVVPQGDATVVPQAGPEVVAPTIEVPTTRYPTVPDQIYQTIGDDGIPEITTYGRRIQPEVAPTEVAPVDARTSGHVGPQFTLTDSRTPEPGNVGPQFPLPDSRTPVDAGPVDALGEVAPAVPQANATLALEDLGAPTIGESFDAIITGGGQGRVQGLVDLFAPNVDRADVADYLKQQGQPFDSKAVTNFIKENRQELGMGALRRYGPIGAGSLALAALSAEEVDPMDLSNRMTGMDLIRQNPETYRVFDPNRTYIPPRYTVTSSAGSNFQPTPLNQPQTAAQGGEIMYFPRMDGPIEGPGTETSDDIPAMLSDGEFVFTAKAVRGAGRGSREDGMKNMYNMMRQFEARV